VPQEDYNREEFGKATLLVERMNGSSQMGRVWIGCAACMEADWLEAAHIDVVVCCVDG
jgi:hypothetical protein